MENINNNEMTNEMEEIFEKYDKDTMMMMSKRIGEILLVEDGQLKKNMDENVDKYQVYNKRLTELEKEIEENKINLETQANLIKELEKTIELANNEAVTEALLPKIEVSKTVVVECVEKSNKYASELNKIKYDMDFLIQANARYQIMSQTLIGFGVNYGFLREDEEEEK